MAVAASAPLSDILAGRSVQIDGRMLVCDKTPIMPHSFAGVRFDPLLLPATSTRSSPSHQLLSSDNFTDRQNVAKNMNLLHSSLGVDVSSTSFAISNKGNAEHQSGDTSCDSAAPLDTAESSLHNGGFPGTANLPLSDGTLTGSLKSPSVLQTSTGSSTLSEKRQSLKSRSTGNCKLYLQLTDPTKR